VPVEPGDDAAALQARIQPRGAPAASPLVVQRFGGGSACRAKVARLTIGGGPCRVTRTTWSSSATTWPRLVGARRCCAAARAAHRLQCSATIALPATCSARTRLPVRAAACGPTAAGRGGRRRVLKELHAEARACAGKLREPKIRGAARGAGSARRSRRRSASRASWSASSGAAAEDWLARWQGGQRHRRASAESAARQRARRSRAWASFERREGRESSPTARVEDAAGVVEGPRPTRRNAALWRHLAARRAAASVANRPARGSFARALDRVGAAGPASAARRRPTRIRELLVEKTDEPRAARWRRRARVTELGVSWGKLSSLTLASRRRARLRPRVVASGARRAPRLAELLGKKAPKRPRGKLAETIGVVGLSLHAQRRARRGGPCPSIWRRRSRCSRRRIASRSATARVLDPPSGETDDAGPPWSRRFAAVIGRPTGALDADRLASKMHGAARRALAAPRRRDAVLRAPTSWLAPLAVRGHAAARTRRPAAATTVPARHPAADGPRSGKGRASRRPPRRARLGYQTGLKNLTLTGDQVLPSPRRSRGRASFAGWSAAKVRLRGSRGRRRTTCATRSSARRADQRNGHDSARGRNWL